MSRGSALVGAMLDVLRDEIVALKQRHAEALRDLGAEIEAARAEVRRLQQENDTLRARSAPTEDRCATF